MKKYNRDTKNNIQNISINNPRKDIIKLKIKSIKLSTETFKNIKSIKTVDSDIEHPPTVTVKFDTGYSNINKDFRIDPFILPPFKNEENKLLGNLLSLADVEWDFISDIIGKNICFYTDTLKPVNNNRKPANYEYLINSNKKDLYHENIESLFIDMIYNHVYNKKLGYATVENINTIDNYVNIDFKLAHKGTFSQKLPLDKKANLSLKHKFKNKVNIHTLFDSTIGPKQNKSYTYWDFCKENIGYVPNQDEYTKVIGEKIDIIYTVAGWKIKNSMSNIHY